MVLLPAGIQNLQDVLLCGAGGIMPIQAVMNNDIQLPNCLSIMDCLFKQLFQLYQSTLFESDTVMGHGKN